MYKIDCESCFKSYIDETGRDLDIRIKEHKFDVKKSKPESGIANRHIETGQNFNFIKNGRNVYPCNNKTMNGQIVVNLVFHTP